MSLEINWDDDTQTILRMRLPERWTIEELSQGIVELYAMGSSVPHIVHIVIDGSESRQFSTLVLTRVRMIADHIIDNLGIVVMLKTPPIATKLTSLIFHAIPSLSERIFFINSETELQNLIEYYEQNKLRKQESV